MSAWPKPMLACSAKTLPIGPEWSYEVKWDGYRAIAVKEGRTVRLLSRNLRPLTDQYPNVRDAVARLMARQLVLDGEIVALDERGRPSFQALQHRGTRTHRIAYYVFDILAHDGADLTRAPLDDRRNRLRAIHLAPPLYMSEPLPGAASDIAKAVRRIRLEGVVAKRRASRYEPGKRSDAWVKVKFLQRQEFVVGGYKPAGRAFESLVVGYYDEQRKLHVAGKVRNGFTPRIRAALFELLEPLESARFPFADMPTRARSHWGEGLTTDDMRTLHWVTPRVVVEIAFVEWTRDGHLRHPAFVAVRHDKRPQEIRREAS